MDPTNVIVVSGEFGDDIQGTGRLMNTSEKGTASKAVKTIARAVELSTTGSVIFVYPGVYSGPRNHDLKVNLVDLTISTLKGPYWTSVNCGRQARFLAGTSSTIVMEGLTLQNCLEVNGGVFNIVDGSFSGTNMLITDSSASQNGGVFYASGSNIILDQVSIVNCSASDEGGAVYLEGSVASMDKSNVTKSTATRGGAMALRGSSSLSTTDTKFFGNSASERGGGTYVNGVVILQGVYLVSNEASSGGGLAMDNGNLTMENCVVSNNTAEIGGGLTLNSMSTIHVGTISTIIQNNKAGTAGGGMYVTGTTNVTFDKQVASPSMISNNIACKYT
ncbi:putative membrane protein [Phytophthora megakarya]|uniref:Putative membrane protein n=1 Tax=Phytophthora megakarya TaxID=4795 RepID=A0A225VYZ7_9STRA|nr:putative membrane protein [Phytophthora megakarya]